MEADAVVVGEERDDVEQAVQGRRGADDQEHARPVGRLRHRIPRTPCFTPCRAPVHAATREGRARTADRETRRLPAPGSRLPAPGSRLPAPGSRLPA
ncbi:hypothetical protein GCM10020229_16170 [Kitasatospora albolonga]